MTVTDARLIAEWRYSDAWSVYDLPSAQPVLDDLSGYFVIAEGERVVGFCCTGAAARVAGMAEEPGVIDIGVGMDPDLVGRGAGERFGQSVLSFLTRHQRGAELRAVIQSWNQRSLRLAHRLGFHDAGEHIAISSDNNRVAYRVVRYQTDGSNATHSV